MDFKKKIKRENEKIKRENEKIEKIKSDGWIVQEAKKEIDVSNDKIDLIAERLDNLAGDVDEEKIIYHLQISKEHFSILFTISKKIQKAMRRFYDRKMEALIPEVEKKMIEKIKGKNVKEIKREFSISFKNGKMEKKLEKEEVKKKEVDSDPNMIKFFLENWYSEKYNKSNQVANFDFSFKDCDIDTVSNVDDNIIDVDKIEKKDDN